jgi:hypothetical protein
MVMSDLELLHPFLFLFTFKKVLNLDQITVPVLPEIARPHIPVFVSMGAPYSVN